MDIKCAGRRIYLVNDRKVIQEVYRRHEDFVFDPFNVWTQKLCGAHGRDLDIISHGQRGLPGTAIEDPESPNVLKDMHSGLAAEFRGENLEEMTHIFIQHLEDSLYEEVGASCEARLVDVTSLLRRCWTLASVTAVFGTHIRRIWPDLNEDFWDFDAEM